MFTGPPSNFHAGGDQTPRRRPGLNRKEPLSEAQYQNLFNPRAWMQSDSSLVWIERSHIEPNNFNPRRYFDPAAQRELGESLSTVGQHQPCVVRPHPDDDPNDARRFQLIIGERRWRASAPEYGDVPRLQCIIRPMNDLEAMIAAWGENEEREDLTSLEKARYLRNLRFIIPGTRPGKPAMWAEVAQYMKMERESILRIVRLLQLPEDILSTYFEPRFESAAHRPDEQRKEWQERFVFNEKHGRALLMLESEPRKLHALAREIYRTRMSGNAAMREAAELRGTTSRGSARTTRAADAPESDRRDVALHEEETHPPRSAAEGTTPLPAQAEAHSALALLHQASTLIAQAADTVSTNSLSKAVSGADAYQMQEALRLTQAQLDRFKTKLEIAGRLLQ